MIGRMRLQKPHASKKTRTGQWYECRSWPSLRAEKFVISASQTFKNPTPSQWNTCNIQHTTRCMRTLVIPGLTADASLVPAVLVPAAAVVSSASAVGVCSASGPKGARDITCKVTQNSWVGQKTHQLVYRVNPTGCLSPPGVFLLTVR